MEPPPIVVPRVNPAAPEVGAVRRNRRRATLIAGIPGLVLGVVLGAVGFLVGGIIAGGAVLVVVAVAIWAAGRWATTGMVLKAVGAEPADEGEFPRPFNLVEGLCATMGLPVPALALIEDPLCDALAVGRSPATATLVMTRGLVERLDPVQLEGVLAHELTHIKRGDIVPATVAAGMLLPLAPLYSGAGDLVHRLAGRGREFEADRLAVGVTRFPPGLCEALEAMGGSERVTSPLTGRHVGRVTRWLWTAALGEVPSGEQAVGELDAPSVRIAALHEW